MFSEDDTKGVTGVTDVVGKRVTGLDAPEEGHKPFMMGRFARLEVRLDPASAALSAMVVVLVV